MKCKKRLNYTKHNKSPEVNKNGLYLRQMHITELLKPKKPIFNMTGKCNFNQNDTSGNSSSKTQKIFIKEVLCLNNTGDILPSDVVACELRDSSNANKSGHSNEIQQGNSAVTGHKTTNIKQTDSNRKTPKRNLENVIVETGTPCSTKKQDTDLPSTTKKQRLSNIKSPYRDSSNYGFVKKLKEKEASQLQRKQLDELLRLMQGVSKNRHISNLLSHSEYATLKNFISFEDTVKYAVMKLFMSKRIWYNIFSFCKQADIVVEDDRDIIDIFEQLQREKCVETQYNSEEDLYTLLQSLDQKKIESIMTGLNMKPTKSKGDNITLILQMSIKQKTLPGAKSLKEIIIQEVANKMGFSIKIAKELDDAIFNICLLGTFTNPNLLNLQAYFQAIIHDDTVFPVVQVEDYPVFYSRSDFLEYAEAIKVYTYLEEAKKTKLGILTVGKGVYERLQKLPIVERDKLDRHLYIFKATHLYSDILWECCKKIFTKGSGFPYEVKKWLEFLIKRFPQSQDIGLWYNKLIWLHMRHLNEINFDQAANILIDVLTKKNDYNLNQASIYDLANLGEKIKSSNKYNVDAAKHNQIAQLMPRLLKETHFRKEQVNLCIKDKTQVKKSSINDVATLSTTQVLLNYYSKNGYPKGIFCEHSIKALFMLFFWDIIYNPPEHIPGTFLGFIQHSPLDMFTEYFYTNGQHLITKRIAEVESSWSDDKIVNFPTENWQVHSHKFSTFGVINAIIPEKSGVSDLVAVIGRKLLARIFSRLAVDLRTYRNGLPDLLIWNEDTKKCRFIVQIKSNNSDQLSNIQLMWLKYLQDNDAEVAICQVNLPSRLTTIEPSSSSDKAE